ncbi:MAG: hypothetical protein HONBIEJF_00357 [Fimbriimonadaceae bacterium]|nr:hypothetical protein [Fimbriimonadaceae bacterium]
MEVKAVAKFIRVQPRKVRIVAREVKGRPAVESAHLLRFHPSKGAFLLRKVLVSAIANAQENHGVSADMLRISRINIDEGPVLKRISQRSMGRGNRINKKMSHITVILEDYEPEEAVKAHGTKPKARPKFDAPKKAAKKKGGAEAATAEAPAAEIEGSEPVEAVSTEDVVAEAQPEVIEEAVAEAEPAAAAEEAAPVEEHAPTEELSEQEKKAE